MLIGHQKQWQFLKRSFESTGISHAYLFSGQEHIGKKTLAIEFIKFLNCQSEKDSLKPCQLCRSCKDIEKGIYPDFLLIEPKRPDPLKSSVVKEEIQISQIREMENRFSFRPHSSFLKTAVIDQAHFMSQEAQNSFLKTLEEPKGDSLFILISEYPEMLLSTILSRVQRINFFPAGKSEIEKYLQSENVPEDKIREIVNFSMGKPGEAISFLKDPKKMNSFKKEIAEINKISQSALHYRFQYVKESIKENKNLKELLDIWLRYFRSVLIEKISGQMTSNNGRDYSLSQLRKIIENIARTQLLLSTTNINPKLALEVLVLEL